MFDHVTLPGDEFVESSVVLVAANACIFKYSSEIYSNVDHHIVCVKGITELICRPALQ